MADADRATLIRRVTFDLTGLPPTPEEIDAFADGSATQAYRHGGRPAAGLAALRRALGRGTGWTWCAMPSRRARRAISRYRNAWRYRDYVIDRFNQDMPYDRFIREQIAGDLLPADSDAEPRQPASSPRVSGPRRQGRESASSVHSFLMDIVDEQIDVIGQAFLGLTVALRPLPRPQVRPDPDVATTTPWPASFAARRHSGRRGTKTMKATSDERLYSRSRWTEQTQCRPIARARSAEAHAAGNRPNCRQNAHSCESWPTARAHGQKGKGKQFKRSRPPCAGQSQGRPQEIKELQDKLDQLEAQRTPPATWRWASTKRGPGQLPGAAARRGQGQGPRSAARRAHRPQDFAGRAYQSEAQRPARSAHWIANKQNPLTARVIVNRVWGHLFGAGLVDTVDNFGALGNEPSHPELLDTLAVQFMDQGWSIKRLIRSIVLSRTYQLSSDPQC